MADFLTLTTAIRPAKKFGVIRKDGTTDTYQILGLDHLSPTEEASSMALFSRYNYLSVELEGQPRTDKGEKVAAAMRAVRLKLLAKLTDMPVAVAEEMPLSQQVLLLEAIQTEVEGDPSDEDDDAPTAAASEPDDEFGD